MAAAGGGSGFGRDRASFMARDPVAPWSSWPHQGHRLWACMSEAFWVYVFKVRRCPQQGSHDWTLCPYAHHGERARRRSPRRSSPYVAVPCPEYRASQRYHRAHGTGEAPSCARGLGCGYAHGVFELWLHPDRFRTRMCDAGTACPRKVCFFAHHPSQRRRGDDPVAFAGGMAALLPPVVVPRPLLPPPPPPRPRPRPRLVIDDAAPVSSLPPRPADMVMQTSRSGQQLPLYGYGGYEGASSSSTAAAVATPAPVDSGSGSAGSSSSSRGADEDDYYEDGPNFYAILDMLERLIME